MKLIVLIICLLFTVSCTEKSVQSYKPITTHTSKQDTVKKKKSSWWNSPNKSYTKKNSSYTRRSSSPSRSKPMRSVRRSRR